MYQADIDIVVAVVQQVGNAVESIAASVAKAAEAYAKSIEQRPQDSETIFNGR